MHKLLRKPETLIFLVSLWIVLTCNAGFWQLLSASFVPVGLISHPLLVVYMAMLAIGLTSLIMLLLAAGPAVRVILALSLLVCSATGFFTARFGILFDEDMLVNVVQTNTAEAFDLMSFPLISDDCPAGSAAGDFCLSLSAESTPPFDRGAGTRRCATPVPRIDRYPAVSCPEGNIFVCPK